MGWIVQRVIFDLLVITNDSLAAQFIVELVRDMKNNEPQLIIVVLS